MAPPIIQFVEVNLNLVGVSPDKFSFGALLGAFTHTQTANRQDGPFFSITEVVDAGFTFGAWPAINSWASTVFSQDDGVDQLIVGRIDAGDLNLTESLDAIESVGSDTWYITNLESRTDADILLGAAWTETREKILIAQTDSADLLAGTPANIGEQLQTLSYNRTALIYHSTDAEYLDGAWSSSGGGLDLDSPDGAGIWKYRGPLEGVPFDAVTGAQANNIWGVNANLYGRNKALSFTSNGTMASGRSIDVTTTLDWIKVRIEEAVLAKFVGTPTKIPYTNAGILDIVTAISEILDAGVSNGHISPDVPYQITAPLSTEVSKQAKIDRELTIQATFTLAGAVEKVILNVNVSF